MHAGGGVTHHLAVAVILLAVGALRAVVLSAAPCLGADTDTVADLDVLDVLAYADGFADDFVANAARCVPGQKEQVRLGPSVERISQVDGPLAGGLLSNSR